MSELVIAGRIASMADGATEEPVRGRVWIRDDGTVEDVKIHESSGDASLDESALSTVRDRWRFVPARKNGVSVSCQALLPIRFRLRES